MDGTDGLERIVQRALRVRRHSGIVGRSVGRSLARFSSISRVSAARSLSRARVPSSSSSGDRARSSIGGRGGLVENRLFSVCSTCINYPLYMHIDRSHLKRSDEKDEKDDAWVGVVSASVAHANDDGKDDARCDDDDDERDDDEKDDEEEEERFRDFTASGDDDDEGDDESDARADEKA